MLSIYLSSDILAKSSYMKPKETAYLLYEALLGEYFCIADLVKLLT
jgi:hypothetical protein